MKRFLGFFGAAIVLGAFVFPHTAEARRPTVHCQFKWNDNPALNVKQGTRTHSRSVRTAEYNRLIAMGTVAARVSADAGQHCQLNHPENTLVDVSVTKAAYKLNPEGRIPNCQDLDAMVTCRGH